MTAVFYRLHRHKPVSLTETFSPLDLQSCYQAQRLGFRLHDMHSGQYAGLHAPCRISSSTSSKSHYTAINCVFSFFPHSISLAFIFKMESYILHRTDLYSVSDNNSEKKSWNNGVSLQQQKRPKKIPCNKVAKNITHLSAFSKRTKIKIKINWSQHKYSPSELKAEYSIVWITEITAADILAVVRENRDSVKRTQNMHIEWSRPIFHSGNN